MIFRCLPIFLVLAFLLPAGCGYRFVDPLPGDDYALASVRNASSEAGLATLLESELRKNGRFRKRSAYVLSVTVTDFKETVESVSSSGTPVRQKLEMGVAWKVEGASSSDTTFGKENVVRTYPYSADPVTLDWNRNAAVHLLTNMASRRILENLGAKP